MTATLNRPRTRTPAPALAPDLARVVRLLATPSPGCPAPPACMLSAVDLLRRAGPTPAPLLREAVRIGGRSLLHRWSRPRVDASLARLLDAGAVVRSGPDYDLSPAVRSAGPSASGPDGYVEFVGLCGGRYFYSRRCASDLAAADAMAGPAARRDCGFFTAIQLALAVMNRGWSAEAVRATWLALRAEQGHPLDREALALAESPFYGMVSVEEFIAERSREYAA